MTKNTLTPDVVLEKSIVLAQQSSWESFSLTELASLLDCSLSDIKQFYRSKDDMAEALFNRADDAMLSLASVETSLNLTSDDKLLECIMVWFESLAPYRSLVREILAYKLEPGHFHLQAHGITRISRTVQWFIEASDRKNTGLKRIADEVAVTSAYLASFSFFLFDNSEQHSCTRALLKSLIRKINQGQQLFFTSARANPVPIGRHNSPETK
jgi:ubiquinone biosynthesis protein COQ9